MMPPQSVASSLCHQLESRGRTGIHHLLPRPALRAPARAAAADLAAAMSVVQLAGDTHHPLGLEAFPGATAKTHWMAEATAGNEWGWTAPAPAPGTICLTVDPEQTTPLQQGGAQEGDRGAQMMRIAVGEEELGGHEEEVMGTNRQYTLNTNLGRNQERATA